MSANENSGRTQMVGKGLANIEQRLWSSGPSRGSDLRPLDSVSNGREELTFSKIMAYKALFHALCPILILANMAFP